MKSEKQELKMRIEKIIEETPLKKLSKEAEERRIEGLKRWLRNNSFEMVEHILENGTFLEDFNGRDFKYIKKTKFGTLYLFKTDKGDAICLKRNPGEISKYSLAALL